MIQICPRFSLFRNTYWRSTDRLSSHVRCALFAFLRPSVRIELLLSCSELLQQSIPLLLVLQLLVLHLLISVAGLFGACLSKNDLTLPSSSVSMILCLHQSLCRTLDVAPLDTNEHALQPGVESCFAISALSTLEVTSPAKLRVSVVPTLVLLHPRDCLANLCPLVESPIASLSCQPPVCVLEHVK